MSLPASPPRYSGWAEMLAPIREGARGWPVYALQRGVRVEPDGDFGPLTKRAAERFQRERTIAVDGVAGPATQRLILRVAGEAAEKRLPDLPHGLVRGLIEGEGASILAATNWYTPPGGAPGVDCGPAQWRQLGPPFSYEGLRAAFDPRAALLRAAETLLGRARSYRQRRPALSPSRALTLSVLAHNAPFLADQFVRNGRLSTPNATAVWTRKPGGGSYTHAEWSNHYPATIMRYVG